MKMKTQSPLISPESLKQQAAQILKTPLCTVLIILCIGMMSAFTPGPLMPETNERMEVSPVESTIGGAYLVFAGKQGGNIIKSELKGQTELQVDGCARGSKIFAFTLEVNRKGKVTKFHAKSNVLTTEMVTALNALETGDSFDFPATKAYLPGRKDEVDVHSDRFVIVASHS